MVIRGRNFTFKQFCCLVMYYTCFIYFPSNAFGRFCRYYCCKGLFKKLGKNVNIERKAVFGSGIDIEIGDNSGIGINACIPGNTIIGRDVMMGPNCYIIGRNHAFDSIDVPIRQQGYAEKKQTIIEDDVWIGRDVTFTPGRVVKKGSIVAACSVLTKDFPEYSIVGGNPARLIRSRVNK